LNIGFPQHGRLEQTANATERAGFRDIVQDSGPIFVAVVPQNADNISFVLLYAFRPFMLFQLGQDRARLADAGCGVACVPVFVQLAAGEYKGRG
jgi:hypothetical protein